MQFWLLFLIELQASGSCLCIISIVFRHYVLQVCSLSGGEKAGDKIEMPYTNTQLLLNGSLCEDFQGLSQLPLKSVGGFPFLCTGKETKLDVCSFKRLLWFSFFFYAYMLNISLTQINWNTNCLCCPSWPTLWGNKLKMMCCFPW